MCVRLFAAAADDDNPSYLRSFTKKTRLHERIRCNPPEFPFTNAYADRCTFLAIFPSLKLPINYTFRGALSENVRFVLDFVLRFGLGRAATEYF